MNSSSNQETSPSDLLASFNGRSLKAIIVFTLVAHAVLLLATSGGYLWRSISGPDTSAMSETERMDLAVKEASTAMRRIAEQHGIKPQDLGSRFSAPVSGSAAEAPEADPKSAEKAEPAKKPAAAPEEPKSTIEQEIKKAEPGPTVPVDDDLFK
jgi:hypothetical protein